MSESADTKIDSPAEPIDEQAAHDAAFDDPATDVDAEPTDTDKDTDPDAEGDEPQPDGETPAAEAPTGKKSSKPAAPVETPPAESDTQAETGAVDYWGQVHEQHPDMERFLVKAENGAVAIHPSLREWFAALPADVRKRAADGQNPYGVIEVMSRLKADIAAGKAKEPAGDDGKGADPAKPAAVNVVLADIAADPEAEKIVFKGDDGNDMTLKSAIEQYGEVGHLVAGIVNLALRKIAPQAAGAPGRAELSPEVLQRLDALDADMADYRLQKVHGDAGTLTAGDDFKAWLKEAPALLRNAFARGGSQEKADVVTQYKREKGLPMSPTADANAAELARRRKLHGSTVRDDGAREDRTPRGGKGGDPDAEFEAAWDETGDVKD